MNAEHTSWMPSRISRQRLECGASPRFRTPNGLLRRGRAMFNLFSPLRSSASLRLSLSHFSVPKFFCLKVFEV